MADREEEDLQMALRMSLQGSPPEAKRSKPWETPDESPEAKERRVQRELMAAAAERRISATGKSPATASATAAEAKLAESKIVTSPGASRIITPTGNTNVADVVPASARTEPPGPREDKAEEGRGLRDLNHGVELSQENANQLFSMLFGSSVSKDILAQWSNQGIRFSSDHDTCMGLVQHEGGPCGVLATIQAFVLKYLLFFPDELGKTAPNIPLQSQRRLFQSSQVALENFDMITEDRKQRALVLSMVEILFCCGDKRRATVATLSVFSHRSDDESDAGQKNEMISKALESLSIESASDLQKVLRVRTYTSQMSAYRQLMEELSVFQNRMGAMLFLISALLSRGLESIQADRDDPTLPLVTAPFGHASQEIVNLLLCGQAVPNVFDGRMDLGGGMFLKGIARSVEVGFLTLLESLNFCKVGQYLKCPKWPIWVVGSESHYTVLFAPDMAVQDENELEERESKVRKAFNAQDQSGGGGFISVDGFHQVLRETDINMPAERLDNLCSTGYIVWSEFWQALLELDKNLGGLKDSTGLMGKKQFDIYHFNGIAKSVLNGTLAIGGESPLQRPRLCKLRVSVPPKWTQEEFMTDVSSSSNEPTVKGSSSEDQLPEPAQHAPLVDCIRTRWPRATCNWAGDPPSIV